MRLGRAELPDVTPAAASVRHAAAVVLARDSAATASVICPPDPPSPVQKGEVVLWFGDPTRPGDWVEAAADLLRGSVYGARADRQKSARSRAAILCAHAGARVLLAQALDCGPDKIAYHPSVSGRPCLKPCGRGLGDGLYFSVSHTETMVAVAVAGDAVGVDVERVRYLPDLEALAAAEFAPALVTRWRALPPDRRLRGFFQCWTVGEAWFKATGQALAPPPSEAAPWLDGSTTLIRLPPPNERR